MGTLIKNAKHLDCLLWTELLPHIHMLAPAHQRLYVFLLLMTCVAEYAKHHYLSNNNILSIFNNTRWDKLIIR